MTQWFAARWRAFLGSFDADEVIAFSTPLSSALAATALVVVFLIVGELPALQQLSRATATWPCVALAALGGVLTITAFTQRCRGTLGSICTLLDNGCYAAALSLAALRTSGGFAIGFAVVQTLMVLLFPASVYGFSLLMALVLTLPTLLLVLCFPPGVTVTLVLVASCVMAPLMLGSTSRRRELVAGAKRLEQALGVTDQVLDAAMQRALTTTLLNLGNFLHELRNLQTGVRLNLELLERQPLAPEQGSVVGDALSAARSEALLLEETLEELRRQAQPREGTTLLLSDVLARTLRGRPAGLDIDYGDEAPRFEVQGEPTHLATVLRNLLRNAAQAGATRVHVTTELDPAAEVVRVKVKDDGPGIAAERLPQLFQPFTSVGKPTGTGLGLYLCRRYVELMQGEIRVESRLGQGATFELCLPGHLLAKAPASAPAPAFVAQPSVAK